MLPKERQLTWQSSYYVVTRVMHAKCKNIEFSMAGGFDSLPHKAGNNDDHFGRIMRPTMHTTTTPACITSDPLSRYYNDSSEDEKDTGMEYTDSGDSSYQPSDDSDHQEGYAPDKGDSYDNGDSDHGDSDGEGEDDNVYPKDLAASIDLVLNKDLAMIFVRCIMPPTCSYMNALCICEHVLELRLHSQCLCIVRFMIWSGSTVVTFMVVMMLLTI